MGHLPANAGDVTERFVEFIHTRITLHCKVYLNAALVNIRTRRPAMVAFDFAQPRAATGRDQCSAETTAQSRPNRARYLRRRSASLGVAFWVRERLKSCRPASDIVRLR